MTLDWPEAQAYARGMPRILRLALLALITLLMINLVVIGIGTENTGAAEKVVLGLIGLALLFAAYKVQTLPRRTRSV